MREYQSFLPIVFATLTIAGNLLSMALSHQYRNRFSASALFFCIHIFRSFLPEDPGQSLTWIFLPLYKTLFGCPPGVLTSKRRV